MLPVFRAGIGGPVPAGISTVPIHLDDVIAALLFCLDHDQVVGPVNLTAPAPVDNTEFSHALGRALGRPAFVPVPGLAVRALYGQMSEIVTSGQRAIPARLLALGFEFRHPAIEPALRDVLGGGTQTSASEMASAFGRRAIVEPEAPTPSRDPRLRDLCRAACTKWPFGANTVLSPR